MSLGDIGPVVVTRPGHAPVTTAGHASSQAKPTIQGFGR